MPIDWEEFREILVRAKKATYASDATPVILEDDSNNLDYREGLYLYKDKWFGSDPFSGEETVLFDRNPIWFMKYSGSTLNLESAFERQLQRDLITESIYTFLRNALSHVTIEKPFRGPEKFETAMFAYFCESGGGI
ncbi:MAG: hypothetical protein HYW24_04335 [Candidatus Aenigmarchaeota archaeon]|nr:hypothetical protein [Candidatus Aenigmarchaeota archaeon]